MHRRFVQLLLSNRVRSLPRYQIPTTAYFCSTTENTSQTDQSWKKPISEKRTNFSDLDPEEFGSLSAAPTVTVEEMLDKLPVEGGDHDVFDILDEKGKKVKRRLEYYEDLVKKLLSENKVGRSSFGR